jgi:succinyl-CoA synthetase beta subunit
MRIHEYQGKEILKRFSISVPIGKVLRTKDDINSFVKDSNKYPQVLKAQVHAGGRGEAGGVLKIENSKQLGKFASQMLDKKLVTKQTGSNGKIVRTLLVEESIKVLKEFYVGVLVDRNLQKVVMMISESGGQNIENAKKNNPSSIKKIFIDPNVGFEYTEIDSICSQVNIDKDQQDDFKNILKSLYKAFIELDASLVEINPLALDESNRFIALDSKWNFDPNGLARHPEILSLRDLQEEDKLEIESTKYNLAYIKLDGTIGCMVNGAGLAMATMDIIQLLGGAAANFLDVGGGASVEKVSKAFEIMSMHPKIKVGFINIFGGIMRCDFVAQGLVNALEKTNGSIPLVVRMKGFKELEAQKILKEAKAEIEIINSFQLAAKRAVNIATNL